MAFAALCFCSTQGLQCSSFLVMTYFLLRGFNILPQRELHWSPWVGFGFNKGSRDYVARGILGLQVFKGSGCRAQFLQVRLCPGLGPFANRAQPWVLHFNSGFRLLDFMASGLKDSRYRFPKPSVSGRLEHSLRLC